MKNTFLILIFVFVFGGFAKSTANEIFIADTTLSRLYPAEIRVQGSLDKSADSVKIVLKYDVTQLKILSVSSDSNSIFMDSVISFFNWGSSDNKYELHITSRKINPNGKYFCNIRVQALISKDTIFRLEPVNLEIDGIETAANFTAGNLLVKNPFKVTEKSGIGYFHPNPFGYESKIEFYLYKDANVSITIYNSFGQMVTTIGKDYSEPEIIFINEGNQITRFNPEAIITKGRYYLNWQPRQKIWPSGAYYIVFNIGGEIYTTNVMMTR